MFQLIKDGRISKLSVANYMPSTKITKLNRLLGEITENVGKAMEIRTVWDVARGGVRARTTTFAVKKKFKFIVNFTTCHPS